MDRDRKHCRKIYYRNKISALKGTKPHKWGKEIKQLCGASENNRPDFRSNLSMNLNCGDYDLANKINEAFIGAQLIEIRWFGRAANFKGRRQRCCATKDAEVTCQIVCMLSSDEYKTIYCLLRFTQFFAAFVHGKFYKNVFEEDSKA